ncbi:MAG: thioredoxin fold domain-containing protein [Epsilonproteobacteria bacterium]|nr:thioredoxin fold domain-containing protein [Campylobacterota bacterium]
MFNKFFYIFLTFSLLNTQLFSQVIDLDKAINKLKTNNKTLMIYLHKTGCPYCERLEEFTFDDDKVAAYMKKHFVLLSFNASIKKDKVVYKKEWFSNKKFGEHLGYDFYPVVLFINKKGEIIQTALGYIEEDQFLTILHEAASKSNKE